MSYLHKLTFLYQLKDNIPAITFHPQDNLL
jgi:hypothetical protein